MILYREMSWRYWAVMVVLLVGGLAGCFDAFYMAAALSAAQVLHFRLREGCFTAFPVQVRTAYLAMLLLAIWEPMNWLFWVLVAGTTAQVLFGYCALARSLSTLPWNRREALSWRLVWCIFSARPVRGNIMQGLPAVSETAEIQLQHSDALYDHDGDDWHTRHALRCADRPERLR